MVNSMKKVAKFLVASQYIGDECVQDTHALVVAWKDGEVDDKLGLWFLHVLTGGFASRRGGC